MNDIYKAKQKKLIEEANFLIIQIEETITKMINQMELVNKAAA